jgi:zinc protease
VLGEGMSSRVFQQLRDEQGLAYATGSSLVPHRDGGHIMGYIGTKPESLEQAREGMFQIFERIKSEPVEAEELQRARNYIVGKFLIDHQTNYKRAFYLGHYETLGMGIEMDEGLPLLIQAVTAEQVMEVAQRYIGEPTVVELVPGSPPTDETMHITT